MGEPALHGHTIGKEESQNKIRDMKTTAYILLATLPSPTPVVMAIVTLVFVASVIIAIIASRTFYRKAARAGNVSRLIRHTMEHEQTVVMRIKTTAKRIVVLQGESMPEKEFAIGKYLEQVHPDDRKGFTDFISRISQGHLKTGEFHFRRMSTDDADNSTWCYIHNIAIRKGRAVPYDVICTLYDETTDMLEQQREEDLSRRYRSIFERSVVGLAIYDDKGMLLAANENMRQIMHFESETDQFFAPISLFERHPFRDIIRSGENTELHFCTRLVIPERNIHTYLELQLKPLLDNQGQVLHYTLTIQDITDERDFYLKNRQNDEEIRKANEKIRRYETELQYLMDRCDMRVWKVTFSNQEVKLYKSLNSYERRLTIPELRHFFLDNVENIEERFANPKKYFNRPASMVRRMRSIFHNTDEVQWNVIDSIPIFDKEGQLEGCFGTIRNITPLIQAQEMLKEETRRANDSARLKSVFMANMTHEIRTPLNSIVGFSDLLPMIESPEDKKEMMRVIMNNCDMLLRLINDILEISTTDGSAIVITPEEVDWAHIFDDLCESLQQRVQEPGVEFIKDNPFTTLTLTVDQRRIQQVITNFVTNAVKYTHEGHIRVGYNIENEQTLYVYCEDTGAGIPKEKQAVIFNRFVKLNDYVQGTGLGLSICKTIATRYGGQIGVDSEGEGHGSTFWLRVPLNKQTGAS